MLAILLSILLMGCNTTRKSEVYVPRLNVEVEKPTLESIPRLDLDEYTLEQQNALAAVFSAYNTNLILLIDYSNKLLETQDVILDYYTEIIKVVN